MINNINGIFFDRFKQYPKEIKNENDLLKKWDILFQENLPQVFKLKKNRSNQLDSIFEQFEANIIFELKNNLNDIMKKNDNIYKMFNANSLSAANALTRTFSTKLGLFWEEIARLSSNVISPELDLGEKIPDVDSIVFYNNNLYYTQLKTQKNTLTGSQAHRVTDALSVFDNSWFVACIDNNANWSYSGSITKLVGKQFWDKTDIEYNKIIRHLEHTVIEIEKLLK